MADPKDEIEVPVAEESVAAAPDVDEPAVEAPVAEEALVEAGVDLAGKHVLMLGAGGAAASGTDIQCTCIGASHPG